ncbi:MAG: hypothetical protein WCA46_12760 [Actinocatenispora sp.]
MSQQHGTHHEIQPASREPSAVTFRPPVTADDVELAVRLAVAMLMDAVTEHWHVPAGDMEWDCWETLEHAADSLFGYAAQLAPARPPVDDFVPLRWYRDRPGAPPNAVRTDPDAGPAGLLLVLEAAGGMLAAVVRTVPPQARAFHSYGVSDPEGFAAMGVVETLVHTHDVAAGLDLRWAPPADLCDRALARLFPEAPGDTERWPTLLWATGRTDLPGRPRPTFDSWHSETLALPADR